MRGLEPGGDLPAIVQAHLRVMKPEEITKDQKRGRGRPATGRDPMVSSRIPAEIVAEVDRWAEENETTRSDAIRQLVERALAGKPGRVSSTKR